MALRKIVPIEEQLDALGRLLVEMTPAELREFIRTRHDPADLDMIERAMSRVAAVGVRSDPASFAHHLDPEYKLWRYVRLISTRIAEAYRGERSKFQAVNMPSQYGKTTLIGNHTPLWLLDQDPTLRIMYLSYSADKAVEEGGKTRDLAEEHASRLNFDLRPDRRARGRWSTPQGGGLYCAGVDGQITGFPADVILADDLIKGWEAAHSPAQRARVWAVWRTQIRMRSQGAKTMVVVAGTRWHGKDIFHELDHASRENAHADQFEFLRLPALAEAPNPTASDPMLREPDPLGRAPGEPLEPERFSLDEVLARASIGSYLAAAIEQQRPAPEEGGEILRAWWRFYTEAPPKFDDVATSWDMKLKDKEAGDYTVGQVWGRLGVKFYLLDTLRGQWPQAIARVAVALLHVRYPEARRHYIENAGYGPEVIEGLNQPDPDYEISDDTADRLGIHDDERLLVQEVLRRGVAAVIPVTPKGPKPVRMRAQSGKIEAGNVLLPEGRNLSAVLIDELAAFPNGDYDDQADAMSQGLAQMSRSSGTIRSAAGQQIPKPKPTASRGGMGRRR